MTRLITSQSGFPLIIGRSCRTTWPDYMVNGKRHCAGKILMLTGFLVIAKKDGRVLPDVVMLKRIRCGYRQQSSLTEKNGRTSAYDIRETCHYGVCGAAVT